MKHTHAPYQIGCSICRLPRSMYPEPVPNEKPNRCSHDVMIPDCFKCFPSDPVLIERYGVREGTHHAPVEEKPTGGWDMEMQRWGMSKNLDADALAMCIEYTRTLIAQQSLALKEQWRREELKATS